MKYKWMWMMFSCVTCMLLLTGCLEQELELELDAPTPTITTTSPPAVSAATATPPPALTPETGRMVHGRIILGYGDGQPVAGAPLQLEPGGEFVAETDGDGRFTLTDLPYGEITVYANHLQFTIPAGDEPRLDLGDIAYPLVHPPALSLADYPPRSTPYQIEAGDFWLVHTLQGELLAFAPVSPDYVGPVTGEACRFVWSKAVQRFIDPCSGDEWELDGRLNRRHSAELWSRRNLDQYPIRVQEGKMTVQLDQLIPGAPLERTPSAWDAQYGITLTVVASDVTALATHIDTLVQVDPDWQMDATTFPPQQALTYPTQPDSLFDEGARTFPSRRREGMSPVADPQTGGIRQLMRHQWQPLLADSRTLTATLTVDLTHLHHQVTLPLDWQGHQPGDAWPADLRWSIGHAAVRLEEVEWVDTPAEGRARLHLTMVDESPDDVNLYCLHLDTADPWQRTCANFSGEVTCSILTQLGEPVNLHLRAGVALLTPFQLVLDVAP